VIPGIHSLADDALAEYIRSHRQRLADRGLPAPTRTRLAGELHAAQQQQTSRQALAQRYHATSDGTPSFDRYHRHGENPSYELAAQMDYQYVHRGGEHVLDWTERTPPQ
jgi:hypothetical protein